jgi:uridylate kinase
MKLVFSYGGSVIAPTQIDGGFLQDLASFLTGLIGMHEVSVVVGGGQPARERIKKLRGSGASEAECDFEGILATRENARALMKALGDNALSLLPETVGEAAQLFNENKILVMGGTEPGHSTDAVAALLAEWLRADAFINASNVNAVYDRNPREHGDAKPLKEVDISHLEGLLQSEGVRAGEYALLDPVALKIMKRSRIKTIILDGRDFDNIKAFLDGRDYRGTTVVY